MRNLIRHILKEEVTKKYPKPTPNIEKLVYQWLNEYFDGSQIYKVEFWKYHGFSFEFCKNGKEIAELIVEFNDQSPDWGPRDKRPLSDRKFKKSRLMIYQIMINELLSDIPIRKNYLIYLIEEWFEDTYLDKIQVMLNKNDLHLDSVEMYESKEGDTCVPPMKKSEDVSEKDMIDLLLKRTLFNIKDIEEHEEDEPGWIEKTYLEKLRNDEYNRLRGQ